MKKTNSTNYQDWCEKGRYTKEEALKAVEMAEEIVGFVKDKLGQ